MSDAANDLRPYSALMWCVDPDAQDRSVRRGTLVDGVPGCFGLSSDAMATQGDVGSRANFACESCRELRDVCRDYSGLQQS